MRMRSSGTTPLRVGDDDQIRARAECGGDSVGGAADLLVISNDHSDRGTGLHPTSLQLLVGGEHTIDQDSAKDADRPDIVVGVKELEGTRNQASAIVGAATDEGTADGPLLDVRIFLRHE